MAALSADERYALDAAYSEVIAAAQAEQRMRQAYEYERLNWLIAKASLASDEPLFAGTIELPDEGGTVQFEEFSTDGRICGARTPRASVSPSRHGARASGSKWTRSQRPMGCGSHGSAGTRTGVGRAPSSKVANGYSR